MQIKKYSVLTISIVMLCSFIAACAGENKPISTDNSPLPTIAAGNDTLIPVDNDFFMLCCENTDVIIHQGSVNRAVTYELIAAFELDEGSVIDVSFDKDVIINASYRPSDNINEWEPGSASIITYKYDNWVELADSILACEDVNNAINLKNKHALEGQVSSKQPKLYSGLLSISFDITKLSTDVSLNTLNIEIQGKTKTYDIGEILLSSQNILSEKTGNDPLRSNSLGKMDLNVHASVDGTFIVPDIEITATADAVLKNILFSGGKAEVVSVSVQKSSGNGEPFTFLWDMREPLELAEGETLSIEVTGKHTIFADNLICSAQFAMLFNCGGEYEGDFESVELYYRMRQVNVFNTYVQHECGKDFISYYTKYLPALEHWGI